MTDRLGRRCLCCYRLGHHYGRRGRREGRLRMVVLVMVRRGLLVGLILMLMLRLGLRLRLRRLLRRRSRVVRLRVRRLLGRSRGRCPKRWCPLRWCAKIARSLRWWLGMRILVRGRRVGLVSPGRHECRIGSRRRWRCNRGERKGVRGW